MKQRHSRALAYLLLLALAGSAHLAIALSSPSDQPQNVEARTNGKR